MKNENLITWIRHPEKINGEELREIQMLVNHYPYFLPARILYLKALYLSGGIRFRRELKSSTVHITDHKQLFRYLNNQIEFEHQPSLVSPSPLASEEEEEMIQLNLEQPMFPAHTSNRVDQKTNTVQLPDKAPSPKPDLALEIDLEEEEEPALLHTPEIQSSGYQLPNEMTLPADRPVDAAFPPARHKKRKKKDELIERFIQSEPTMPKINTETTDNRDLSKEIPYAQEELFSETLAKIYVKQHLYEKAIATYIKLSLKYPEKSVYFADRIEKIKENLNNKE